MLVDFNHGSGFVYGRVASDTEPLGARINGRIDAALEAEREGQRTRDYLGASRIGEPCARRLVYEVTHTPPDPGKELEGRSLRISQASDGHFYADIRVNGSTNRFLVDTGASVVALTAGDAQAAAADV